MVPVACTNLGPPDQARRPHREDIPTTHPAVSSPGPRPPPRPTPARENGVGSPPQLFCSSHPHSLSLTLTHSDRLRRLETGDRAHQMEIGSLFFCRARTDRPFEGCMPFGTGGRPGKSDARGVGGWARKRKRPAPPMRRWWLRTSGSRVSAPAAGASLTRTDRTGELDVVGTKNGETH